jgi:O-antigen/teichoic acid export membrane protein/polysaccharide pyruvyl transferase WcaK-like protein
VVTDSKHRGSHATLWAYVQNWSARGITLVVFFTLARLLTPTEFGAFAVAMVFLTLGELFVEQLFAPAIVQRRELDADHLDAAFWFTIGCAALLTLTTLLAGPFFARIFDAPTVAPLIMSLSPVFVLMALSAVPAALLRRHVAYRALAQRTTACNLLSGAVAIAAAVGGLGVWAFVLQQLTFQLVGTVILWRNETWRPRLHFKRSALRDIAGFSTNMMIVKLLDVAETRFVELLVGRQLGLAALGSYALASRAHQAATQLVAAPLWDSANGVFARLQGQPAALQDALRRRLLVAATIISPIFLFAAAAGELLIPAVFGSKWTPAVAPFQVLCFLGAVRAVMYLYSAMLQALGAASSTLRVAMVRTAVTLLSIPILFRFGSVGVAACLLAGQLVVLPLVFHVIRTKLEVSPLQVINHIAKPMMAALAAAALGWGVAHSVNGALPAALGASLSLFTCALAFVLLLSLLMPRTLLGVVASLPLKVGRLLSDPLDRLVRVQDRVKVAAIMLQMRMAVSRSRRSRLSEPAVVVSGDAYSVTGSVGDQALFGGLVSMLKRSGATRARVLCRPGAGMPTPDGLGVTAMPLWGSMGQAGQLARQLQDANAFILIGADVLDGFYSRFESLLRLKIAEFCAERGVPTLLISFSFNGQPDRVVARAMADLPASVVVLCRDKLSHERLVKIMGDRVTLTADVAFNLQPSEHGKLAANVRAWLDGGHHGNGPVIAWNLSPHALQDLSADQRSQAMVASGEVISRLITQRDASVVLLPHDFRSIASDYTMLNQVLDQVPAAVRHRVLLAEGPYTAADVKECCQNFDLVLTGRMHLMIAALGRDVPVLAVEYQAKFIGMLTHFDMSSDHILEGRDIYEPDRLQARICSTLDRLAQTRQKIASHRPKVEHMASDAILRSLPKAA